MDANKEQTLYLQKLEQDREQYQVAIENLLENYHVIPVGNGYIDLIVTMDKVLPLIEELTHLPVAIHAVTWWCHYTPENQDKLGCPHGYGGPGNAFGTGHFSECVQYPDFDIENYGISLSEIHTEPAELAKKCNVQVSQYIRGILPREHFYAPCLTPGLWLYVPESWKRVQYFKRA